MILILISFSAIFCEDKSTENISSNSKKYEIVLSDWNGKMGVEDHIIQIKTDGSFIQTAIGWEELCGNLTDKEYGEIIFQLNNINPFKINLFHNNLCIDADGEKQNTKLVITDIEKNKTNTLRWSDCEFDEENVKLIEHLNIVKNNIYTIISNSEKHLCN